MAWALLITAILLEVCGTICMKLSHGFTRLLPSVLMFVFYAACFTVFTFALKTFEVSTAYAIWAGLGTALIAIVGLVYFKEEVNNMKILGLGLVIVGIVLLNLSGTHR